jgi:hypothetical protein
VAAAIVAGVGNSVFHPCDFSILNARVDRQRAGLCLQRARHRGLPRLRRGAVYGIAMAAAAGWRGALARRGAIGAVVIADPRVPPDAIHVEPADGHKDAVKTGLLADVQLLLRRRS